MSGIGAAGLRRPFTQIVSDLVLLSCFLFTSFNLWIDYRTGGNSWKQADWLINNAAGTIRRGPFGSALLALSDALGSSPLLLLCLLQFGLLIAVLLTWRAVVMQVRQPALALLLVLSPGLFTIFWIADPQGAVRKEMLAFLGLGLIALGALRTGRTSLWAGVAVLALAMVAHEGMVLFLPTVLAVLLVSGLFQRAARLAWSVLLVTTAAGSAALLFALLNSQLSDSSALCAALTSRGLSPTMCTGAIKWLLQDSSYGLAAVSAKLTSWNLVGFLVAYGTALLPFLYMVWLGPQRSLRALLLLALGLPFLPLYPVAIDWGRWISFHAFSAAVIIATALASGRFQLLRAPGTIPVLALLALALIEAPRHQIGSYWGGVLRQAATSSVALLR